MTGFIFDPQPPTQFIPNHPTSGYFKNSLAHASNAGAAFDERQFRWLYWSKFEKLIGLKKGYPNLSDPIYINPYAVGRESWILLGSVILFKTFYNPQVLKYHQRQPQVFSFNF